MMLFSSPCAMAASRGLLAVKGLQCRGKILHACLSRASSDSPWDSELFGGVFGGCGPSCASGLVGGFGGRIRVLRRGIKRWGFEFGVQRIVLDLFRIQDVCHNCQLRDSWVGGPV